MSETEVCSYERAKQAIASYLGITIAQEVRSSYMEQVYFFIEIRSILFCVLIYCFILIDISLKYTFFKCLLDCFNS